MAKALRKLRIEGKYLNKPIASIILNGEKLKPYQKDCDTGYSRGTHVYCGTIHNSHVMETAKMPHH
jgi:hypothetical protein